MRARFRERGIEYVHGRIHPDLFRMLNEVRAQYAAEVSGVFAAQVDSGPARATRSPAPTTARMSRNSFPQAGPSDPTEHDVGGADRTGVVKVPAESMGMLGRLHAAGSLKAKSLMPKQWDALMKWEPAPSRAMLSDPLTCSLDYMRVRCDDRGVKKVKTMVLTAQVGEPRDGSFSFHYERPVTNDHDINSELYLSIKNQATENLRDFAQEMNMLEHGEHKIAKLSLTGACNKLVGLLDVVRRQEDARRNFRMPPAPDWSAQPYGPCTDAGVFLYVQSMNYVRTGFKSLAPESPMDDGFPPTRWEGPMTPPDDPPPPPGDPPPPPEGPPPPPGDAGVGSGAPKRAKPSKRRRERMAKETANMFRGVLSGEQPVSSSPPEATTESTLLQDVPTLAGAPGAYTVTVRTEDVMEAKSQLEATGHSVEILRHVPANGELLHDADTNIMVISNEVRDRSDLHVQLRVIPPRAPPQPLLEGPSSSSTPSLVPSHTKPSLPAAVAEALKNTKHEVMRARFADRLAERYDLGDMATFCSTARTTTSTPSSSHALHTHGEEAMPMEVDSLTACARTHVALATGIPATQVPMETVTLTQEMNALNTNENRNLAFVGPQEPCHMAKCHIFLPEVPFECVRCKARVCGLHYVQFAAKMGLCRDCDLTMHGTT